MTLRQRQADPQGVDPSLISGEHFDSDAVDIGGLARIWNPAHLGNDDAGYGRKVGGPQAQTQSLLQILDFGRAPDDVAPVPLGDQVLQLRLILIPDFAHDLLDQVLNAHQSADRPVLVDDDGDVLGAPLHLPKQVRHLLGLWNEQRRRHQPRDREHRHFPR